MRSLDNISLEISKGCGPKLGLRIVHVSDFHNRLTGFRLVSAMVKVLEPEVVINTGDLSGMGTRLETFAMRRLCDFGPQVFAPGNHDSEATIRGLASAGAQVLDEPRLVEVGGINVWGYRDPNETPLFGPSYDPSLCEHTAAVYRPPEGRPLVVAVHHRTMFSHHPDVKLLLTGHAHSQTVGTHGRAVWVRCGSTGGGRPFGGPLQAAVVDVESQTLDTKALWLINVDDGVSIRRVAVGEKRA